MSKQAQTTLTAGDIVRTLNDLPSPPEAYYALTRLLDEPRWDVREAAAIVERETALAARVLKVANSPYFGLSRKVGNISQAVMSIGSRELRNIVLISSIADTFDQISPEVLTIYDFWKRALRVAVNAQLLAARGPLSPLQGELFIAGLLHDIGSLIICLKLPELARKALLYRPDAPEGAVFSIERAVLGYEQAAVGRELLRRWRLPPLLELAVGCHPVPEQAEEHAAAAATVRLALHAAATQELDLPISTYFGADDPIWPLAQLEPNAVEEIREESTSGYQAALSIFDL